MSTLLVTGGAGFIGSNFIRYMLNKYPSYSIINLDLLTYAGNLDNIADIDSNPNYLFVKGDIADRDIVGKLVSNGVNYIINFAAESHVDRSIENPALFLRTNILGTQVLLDAAKEYHATKFLQISTDEVYGSLGPTGYFTEQTPLAPNSPYAASKASADLLVRAYHNTYGLPINITRCSNNYGPYQFPEKLIPLMISNALDMKPLPVYGDGRNVRDWLHVLDHCRAIDAVLHHGRDGEVYNIGGHNERTNIDIVRLILRVLKKPENLIQYVTDRLGHDRRYAIDAGKIETELAWKPAYTFEKGIAETIVWYVQHRDWWQKIKSGEYRQYYERMYGHR